MGFYEEKKIIYFRICGRPCTDITLQAAVSRAKELNINSFVVASTRGFTAKKAIALNREQNADLQIYVVGEHCGYHTPGKQEMDRAAQNEILNSGAKLFFGTHALSGVGRSFRLRWGGMGTAEIVADAFRRFSRGLKAAMESCIMLADAGLIPIDQDVVAVGGSGGGADSALVVRPAHMNTFYDIKVREVIAMPRYRQREEMIDILQRHLEGKKVDEIAVETDLPVGLIEEYVTKFVIVKEALKQGFSEKEISLKIHKGINSTSNYIELAKYFHEQTV